uniref:Uncharacterized protein n=1 Tax=Rhizophora mucronata TaxID=61149 RepID=A0A2P2Q407_RHIMU
MFIANQTTCIMPMLFLDEVRDLMCSFS